MATTNRDDIRTGASTYTPGRPMIAWNWIAIVCFVAFAALFFVIRFR